MLPTLLPSLVMLVVAQAPPSPPSAARAEACVASPALRTPDALDRMVEAARSRYGIVGLGVAVEVRGRVVAKRAYGLASVELSVPVTTCTVFQLSSATKPVTGAVLMKLVETGALALDDSAGRFLANLPAGWGSVTVRQLATHTSGLPDITDLRGVTADSALAIGGRRPRAAAAGATWQYNQMNYFLLKRIVERVVGQGYQQYVHATMFGPLGMEHTSFGAMYSVVPGRATSYVPDDNGGLRVREYDFPDYLFTAAGLNSTLDDLLRWTGALVRGGVLAAATRDTMWSPARLAGGAPVHYAIGWDVGRRPGHRSAGHEGGGNVAVRRFIDDSVTVILLTNGARGRFDVEGLVAEVAAIYEPDLQDPATAAAEAIRAAVERGDTTTARGLARGALRRAGTTEASLEAALNRTGYDLLRTDNVAHAIFVFRVNTELFPGSANAYDSLGEAYLRAQEPELARAAYAAVLRLAPDNAAARAAIARLAGPPA